MSIPYGERPANSPQQPTTCRSLARRCRASFQRDAARRAAGTGRHVAAEWSYVGRLASECSETQISVVGTRARLSSLPRRVGNSARFALGLMRRSASLRESRPARSEFLANTHEGQLPRAAPLARTAPGVRDWARCGFAASHEHRSRERYSLPLARRFCQSVACPRTTIGAFGRAASPGVTQTQ